MPNLDTDAMNIEGLYMTLCFLQYNLTPVIPPPPPSFYQMMDMVGHNAGFVAQDMYSRVRLFPQHFWMMTGVCHPQYQCL